MKSTHFAQREQPAIDESMRVRASALRPTSINEDERTVEAIFATDTPARVYHSDIGRVIDEVLLPSGLDPVDQVPLLEMHNRYDLQATIGSGESPRAVGNTVVGTLRFGRELGERVDGLWTRVRDRHLRYVSAGYEVIEFEDIQPGRTAMVAGRSFTAGDRVLRVTTRWRLREISLVVVPADPNASVRGDNGAVINTGESSNLADGAVSGTTPVRDGGMNFLAYLASLGMATGADSGAVRSFVAGLTDEQRQRALELANATERSAYFADANQPEPPQPTRSADPVQQITGAVGGDGGSGATEQALQAERQRAAEIMRLAGGQVTQDLVNRAVSEGWSVERAGLEFYRAAQAGQSRPVGHGGHIGIHSRSASSEVTMQALQMGLMMRLGVEPDSPILSSMQARGMLSQRSCQAGWIVEAGYALRDGNASDEASRAIEIANRRLRRRSIPDIAAECLRMSGYNVPEDREELIQRAYTVSAFTNIFTTNFSVMLLRGYMEAPDSTIGWCGEEDLPDFQTHDLIQSDPLTSLRKKTRGVPGQQVEGGDRKESYAASRFVGTFVLDEMDMMNDRLRAFAQTPLKLGAAARRIRPTLVYEILLTNPTMSDSVALFATGHGNLAGSAALSSATLSAAEAAMAKQTRNGAVLDLQATHLIVARSQRHLANRLVGSSELRDTTSSTEYGTMNPNQGQYTVVADARLDNGFADPDDPQTTISGQPASWFLADSNAPGIMVGYVEGSGRAPRVRSRVIDRSGEYGMEWDVNMDIGAVAADYVGLLKRQAASL